MNAEVENAHAALYNPALLAAGYRTLFSFSTAVNRSQVSPIKQVVIRDPKTNQLSVRDYELENVQTTVWTLGFNYPFLIPNVFSRMMGIGFALSGPYQKLRSLTSHAPDDFYSVRYGNSDSQFKATLGTALTTEHLPLLRRGEPKVILAYDGDKAGLAAAFKASVMLSQSEFEGGVIIFADGMDPADMVHNGKINDRK